MAFFHFGRKSKKKDKPVVVNEIKGKVFTITKQGIWKAPAGISKITNIKSGEVHLRKDLKLPLPCPAGAEIRFDSGVLLVNKSAVACVLYPFTIYFG